MTALLLTVIAIGSARAAEHVTIYRDVWGIPHIYAPTELGAFYGQGEEIGPNTFVSGGGFDAHLPHHFVDEAGARRLLSGFTVENLAHHVRTEYQGDGSTRRRAHWFALCRK
jgi:hypothetical protein